MVRTRTIGIAQLDGSNTLVFVGIVAATALVGVAFLVGASRVFRRFYRIVGASTPASADGSSAFVTVEGTVRKASGTVTTPHSDVECVVYNYRRQIFGDPTGQDVDLPEDASVQEEERHKTWRTVSSETETVPFDVETDEGTVRVEPDGAHVGLETDEVGRPSAVKRVFNSAVGRFIRDDLYKERHLEGILEDGDRVLVAGEFTRSNGSDALGTVEGDNDESMYVVTDRSKTRLAARYLGGTVLFGLPGLACLALAIGVGVTVVLG